jgi:hypothetical protein
MTSGVIPATFEYAAAVFVTEALSNAANEPENLAFVAADRSSDGMKEEY